MSKQPSMISPLKKARGLGSAKSGSHHWLMQRITAIALLFLSLWFIGSVLFLLHDQMSYHAVSTWLAKPWNAIGMILFIIASFYHAVLGAQVIVEDYIHVEWFKMMKLIGMKLFYFGLATACIFSILKVAFGG